MKHIKRTKHGLVEKKTGRKIVSPLEPMVRQETVRGNRLLNIDAANPDAVCITNPPRHSWKSNLDPSNENAICVTNPYGVTPRKVLEQDQFSKQEDQTGYPKPFGNEDKGMQHPHKKLLGSE